MVEIEHGNSNKDNGKHWELHPVALDGEHGIIGHNALMVGQFGLLGMRMIMDAAGISFSCPTTPREDTIVRI
jgi:hypothetical protein